MRLREIKHCRLAMVGFFFMVPGTLVTNLSLLGWDRISQHGKGHLINDRLIS